MFMSSISRTYRKWDSMKGRCYRKSHPAYKYYGGRGIKICDRWLKSYKAFLDDMGEAPEDLTLDRIDNAGNYEPGNCKWSTWAEQAKNRRSRPQIAGSLRQRARAAGMPYARVYQRVRMGWPIEKALSIPIQKPGGMTYYSKREHGLMQ